MRRTAAALSVALAAPSLALPGVSPLFRAAANGAQAIPGRYIVTLDPTANLKVASIQLGALAEDVAFGSQLQFANDAVGEGQTLNFNLPTSAVERELPIVNGLVMSLTPDALEAIRADPNVAYVEEDSIVYGLPAVNVRPLGEDGGVVQRAAVSWGLDRINQRDLPLDSNAALNGDGAGVDVYVVDTGVEISHPQFEGRASNYFTAYSYSSGFVDKVGHGTHCAGTIASKDYGVAPKANIKNVRVLGDTGSGSKADTIWGMDKIRDRPNKSIPAMVSMSLGGSFSQSQNDAVQRLIDDGLTVIIAAGNENKDACNTSPASAPNAITVGATGNFTVETYDTKAFYSNFGRCVDILAPGSAITSTWIGNSTKTISGTSMATPHVAGAAAVYLSLNPTAKPAQVEAALKGSATPNKITGFDAATPNLLLFANFAGTATPITTTAANPPPPTTIPTTTTDLTTTTTTTNILPPLTTTTTTRVPITTTTTLPVATTTAPGPKCCSTAGSTYDSFCNTGNNCKLYSFCKVC